MQFGRGKPSAGAFYDSDFTTIDQVLAVGLLNGLQGKNDLRVAIVTMSRPNLAAVGYIDMVERYYRGPAGNFAQVPPIGMRTVGSAGETSPAFTAPFQNAKRQNRVKTVIDTGDPNTLFRNYLEAQYDQNAFFVLAGPATNLAAALDFRGMKELIAAKAKYLVAALPSSCVRADVAAARKLFAEWPTRIIVAADDVGEAAPFPGASIDKEFAGINPDNPFGDAYKAYKPMPYDAPSAALAAALYAGRPKEEYFKVSEPGAATVRDDGTIAFAPAAQGKHQTLSVDPAQKDKIVQAYVELCSAKPVLPQRFRPPVAADGKAPDAKTPDAKAPAPKPAEPKAAEPKEEIRQ
ncbi:MAG TPA: hypothetical protein VKB79_18255 [Bryobacteraceae bacterium]|nr:hypothetical protein [Bryobacteraceae bacterium]